MSQAITSLEGFTRKIRSVQPAADEVLLYRGHSDRRAYRLLPSVMRESRLLSGEHKMLRELVSSHPSEFASDSTTLEQMARSQHYSLPTRLLDVTWNPLVALYFASGKPNGKPGGVIVFRVKKSRVKFYDSDTVSCIANLANLKPAERDAIDFSLTGDAFNQQPNVVRLLQFVRAEKPHFSSAIIPSDLKSVLCVIPKRNSQRILVQSGAFLLFGIFGDLDGNVANGIAVERIHVNGNRKDEIRAELDRMAINESALFPEIENAARYISGRV